ncbi:Spo0E family sporulation regulatory protein-aspartic acid phosphatase [Paenibacillus aestuarii]|uniref:Spo0E family sporulation regulatory protein-aspartic acid phosphatase n=1 Tax=Paenibacillus aestuarii TaxID=516965 RepID=A0ABW0KC35_9BACL
MSEQELRDQIESIRVSLNEIGSKYGLGHPEVLRKSQQLDLIHNKFQKLMMGKIQ